MPMDAWRRFRALNAADRSLVTEATALLIAARMGTALLSFPALRQALDFYVRRTATKQTGSAHCARIAWAVSAVARRLPSITTCLVESLAADAMLRRRDYACEIRFGVRAGRGSLTAHAWVEHQGVVIFGAGDDAGEYAVLSSPERS